ncbi:hypothetical protein [Motilimonas sp. E26]|uniref:hypothetical protein n=1 Tax=Motilimonas sp. E26 TaxID=2865674 RepID=UPI001E4254FC|nr:hypothetical protein [Motilimonas sp. E26]MCE0557393.1 hypothetical protein [Motilimonas sp. E26]
MKKFIIAATVASILTGCSSDSVEKALLTDLSQSQAEQAAKTVVDATSLIVSDILEQCNFNYDPANDCAINGKIYTPSSSLIKFDDKQIGIDNFEDLNLKVSYNQAEQVITLTSDNSGKYLQYDNNLQTSYSSEGDLDHKLVINVAGLATDSILVNLDAQNIMELEGDSETFRSFAENVSYDSNSQRIKGKITIKTQDSDRDFDL